MTTIERLAKRLGKWPRHYPVEIPNFGRNDLAVLFEELGFDRGAEIGVKEGDYSAVLLRANPRLHLMSIDPWLVRPDYSDKRGQGQFDAFEAKARSVLSEFGARSQILKRFSTDVAAETPDRSLDFVYIDGHHSFKACTDDIVAWSKKVKVGGIISGHDYARYKYGSDICVYEVVNAYTAAYAIRPWFVCGLKSQDDPTMTRDKHRSWFWVNDIIKTPSTRV